MSDLDKKIDKLLGPSVSKRMSEMYDDYVDEESPEYAARQFFNLPTSGSIDIYTLRSRKFNMSRNATDEQKAIIDRNFNLLAKSSSSSNQPTSRPTPTAPSTSPSPQNADPSSLQNDDDYDPTRPSSVGHDMFSDDDDYDPTRPRRK